MAQLGSTGAGRDRRPTGVVARAAPWAGLALGVVPVVRYMLPRLGYAWDFDLTPSDRSRGHAIIWCAIANHRELTPPVETYGEAHREAGVGLAGVAAIGEPVMDRKPRLAFYANLPYRVIPEAPYDRLLDHAVASGVRYLVLDEAVVRVFRPQLRPLIYDPAFRARERRVELIYAGGHFAGYGIMIFRVLRTGEVPGGAPPRFDVRRRRPDGSLPPGTRAP